MVDWSIVCLAGLAVGIVALFIFALIKQLRIEKGSEGEEEKIDIQEYIKDTQKDKR